MRPRPAQPHLIRALRLLPLATLLACSSSDGSSPAAADGSPDSDASPADLAPPDPGPEADAVAAGCPAGTRPMVLLHGFLAGGDTWANHAMRFQANGHSLDCIYAFDWNTLGDRDAALARLVAFVDHVLAETGGDGIDLIGHSAGGGLSYSYLEDPARAARVVHYVHVASMVTEGPPGPDAAPVATLNLYSAADMVIDDVGPIAGVANVDLVDADHYEAATSAASFEAIYRFLHEDTDPATTAIPPAEPIWIAGKAQSLGENIPDVGAAVSVYALDPATGGRLDAAAPEATFTTDEAGRWGPFDAVPGVPYEVLVVNGDERIHYYREPFQRSNPFVYLRTLPDPTSLAGFMLGGLTYDDAHAVLINFTSAQAVIAGRDSLTAGDVDLATETLASADQTTIALFLYDANENGATDGDAVDSFAQLPFLNGVDVFLPAGETIRLTFNGRQLNVPAWPSVSEGPVVAVFD